MSLRWKSALYVFCVSLIAVPLVLESALRTQQQAAVTQDIETHQQSARYIESKVQSILASPNKYNFVPAQGIIDTLVFRGDYQGIYLYNKNQPSTIYLATKQSLPSDLPIDETCDGRLIENSYCFDVPENENIRLLMVLNNSVSVDEKLLILEGNSLFKALIVILLISFAGYFFGAALARKLEQLVVGVSKASGGNYSQRLSSDSEDELGQLITSYNRMLDNLQLNSQEIKEQLQNYKSILSTAAEGILSINDRGIIQEFNQSAEKIFGYSAKEIIGKNITTLIPSKISTNEGGLMEQYFIGNDSHDSSRELVGVRKEDQQFPMELAVSVSTINNSQIYTGIIRDISDRKKAANKQKSLELQLRKLQRQETLESLSGGIAHDFNNILGPVLGYADMAMEEVEEGTRLHKYLSSILAGAHKARELISRIMTFSRQSESPRENLNLIDIVEDSVDLLKSSMPSSIQLKTYNNTSRDRVAAEKTQLSQVLVTIVNNAIQALEGKDGEINIRVDNIEVGEELLVKSPRLHAGNYVRLRVEDNGIGMDTATLERVFEPFFSTRANGEGSGLGLSVAYGIISNFGGEILVESSIGEGSTFTVLLPSHEGMPNRDAITHIDKPVSQGGELVLYIDDDIEIAELGKEMLENLGYEVAISTSSEQALEMFRSDPEDFDVIITDQSMPVLTGTQLAREIKRVNPTIPIILVTGFSASMLNQELVNSGINHCIAKPVVADELGRAILQVLTENNNT